MRRRERRVEIGVQRRIRCSDIGLKCKRLLWFKSIGFDTPELLRRTVLQKRLIEIGSVMERFAVKWLAEEGYTVFYPERGESDVDLFVKVGDGYLRGNIDLLVKHESGKWYVGEVKTTSSEKLFIYKSKQDLWDLAKDDDMLYRWLLQGSVYALMFGSKVQSEGKWWEEFDVVSDRFYLIFVGREVPVIFTKEVCVDLSEVKRVLEDVVEVFSVKELEKVVLWSRLERLCEKCAYDKVCSYLEAKYAVE